MSEQPRAQFLGEALSLGRELLARMQEVISQVPEGSPYREVIERHRLTFEESIRQLEAIEEVDELR